jgi:hypothetical protein
MVRSGLIEFVTAISTTATSTAPGRTHRTAPDLSPNTHRAARLAPRNRASASFGRKNGISSPRSIPATRGVTPMSR